METAPMNNETIEPKAPHRKGKSSAFVFILASMPTVILSTITVYEKLSGLLGRSAFLLAFAASVACALISSFGLFRRGTVWTIVAGIFFLALNAFISLLFFAVLNGK
jgi:hypothetical protein